MYIRGKFLSQSVNRVQSVLKGVSEKLGIVQKEVQECVGKSAQEIAEMTSKKDITQLSTQQVSKKMSIAEKIRNFRAKLADKLTNKIPIKDKSSMKVDYRYSDDIRKSVSGIYEQGSRSGDYYTEAGGYSINWSLSKNPIKRLFGLNNIDSVYVNGSHTVYRKARGLGYWKTYDGVISKDSPRVYSIPKEARYYARPLP